jgi:hypothetical protein
MGDATLRFLATIYLAGCQRFWCISRAKDDPTLHDLLGIFEHQELASNATQRFITNRSTEVMLA